MAARFPVDDDPLAAFGSEAELPGPVAAAVAGPKRVETVAARAETASVRVETVGAQVKVVPPEVQTTLPELEAVPELAEFETVPELAEFETVPERAEVIPLPTRLERPLTIGDLVAIQLPLAWHEAVALVGVLVEDASQDATIPDPVHVEIAASGDVLVNRSYILGGDPARRASALLKQLLPPTGTPPGLRALANDEAIEGGRHRTLAEFRSDLAYFERPSRRADLAAVRARGIALREKVESDREVQRLRDKAVYDGAPKAPTKRLLTLPGLRDLGQVGAVAVMCVAIGASLATLLWIALVPIQTPVVQGSDAAETAAATSAALGTTLETLVQRAGLGDIELPGRSKPQAGRGSAARQSESAAREPRQTTAGTIRTADGPPARAANDPPVRETWTVVLRDIAPDPAEVAAYRNATPAPSAGDSQSVFTPADREVVPAELIRPQMPTHDEASDATSLFDLVIDETGRVQMIRLVSPDNRFNDRMLIAAAKAWLFRPALRAGRPVKYRMQMWIDP
jgi:hypothetical protein